MLMKNADTLLQTVAGDAEDLDGLLPPASLLWRPDASLVRPYDFLH